MDAENTALSEANKKFWNEPCGSTAAAEFGATNTSTESLKQFDGNFFDFYPYLESYLALNSLAHSRTLEIGLGYGSVGQKLAEASAFDLGMLRIKFPRKFLLNNLGKKTGLDLYVQCRK